MSVSLIDQWIHSSTARVSQTLDRFSNRLGQAFSDATLLTPDDLDVLDNGLVYDVTNAQRLKYMWFHVSEREGGRTYQEYRVVQLLQLRLIPMDVRADPGVLARMRTVLRGLYGAEVELVYLVAGMFHPKRLGIVQLYGVIGRSQSIEEAEGPATISGV